MSITLGPNMIILIYIAVVILVFFFMEFVAWFLHKFVMHGFGWFLLHEDHHRFTNSRFEKNDAFGVVFGIISFLLILTGRLDGYDIKFAIGLGIMAYGIAYFLVHDVFFHRRIKLKYKPKSKYMKRVLHAHTIHHKKTTAYKGVCFGFVLASKKFA